MIQYIIEQSQRNKIIKWIGDCGVKKCMDIVYTEMKLIDLEQTNVLTLYTALCSDIINIINTYINEVVKLAIIRDIFAVIESQSLRQVHIHYDFQMIFDPNPYAFKRISSYCFIFKHENHKTKIDDSLLQFQFDEEDIIIQKTAIFRQEIESNTNRILFTTIVK